MGSSEQNLNDLTVAELRKECRSMNPQPATGVAISGANKEQLIAWLRAGKTQLPEELVSEIEIEIKIDNFKKIKNKVTGYAVDSHSCRSRYFESDSTLNLKRAIQEILKIWNYEANLPNSKFRVGGARFDIVFENEWNKLLDLKNNKEKFTTPTINYNFKPLNYKSVFSSKFLNGGSTDDTALIENLDQLKCSIKKEDDDSIDKLLKETPKYTLEKPTFKNFPEYTKEKFIPHSYKIKDKIRSLKPVKPSKVIPDFITITFSDIFKGRIFKIDKMNREEIDRAKKENEINDHNYLEAYKEWEYIERENAFNIKEIELVKGKNDWLEQFHEDRALFIEHERKNYNSECKKILNEFEKDKSKYESEFKNEKSEYKRIIKIYDSGDSKSITDFFKMHLTNLPRFGWWANKFDLQFDTNEGILLIELQLPFLRDTDIYKTKESAYEEKLVPATKKEAQTFIESILYLLILRHMWIALQVDYKKYINLICCNGHVVHDDPATGIERDDIIMSVSSNREDLIGIKLDRVEPKACFKKLKGVSASKLTELVPINPILKFNKSDSRFVKGQDVLDDVGEKNLASMDWQEFEHLIREIFEKVYSKPGVEVKITQASRDRGVDSIVFDPDPLYGGKYVIQAKRYTNTVDVSSVRDLYGTVMNEGADRGILVTTSDYGRDSYEFAKDKQLTLLNGSELLHLLKKHGYNAKIDLKEAKKLLEEEKKISKL
jgi:restriction system protein